MPYVFADSSQPFFERYHPSLQKQVDLKGVNKDFSGLMHLPGTTRYLILDDICRIVEAQIQVDQVSVIGQTEILGLDDCEAISLMEVYENGKYQVAVVEERRGTMAIFDWEHGLEEIDCPLECRIYPVAQVTTLLRRNSGIEALAVKKDSNGRVIFFFGKEQKPKKFYRGFIHNEELVVEKIWDPEEMLPKGSDIADMFIFENRLFLLDERTEVVREVNRSNGKVISEYKLPRGGSKRYEGLSIVKTLVGDVKMVLVSEPSRVSIFELNPT